MVQQQATAASGLLCLLGADNREKECYLPISLAQTYTRWLRTQEVNRLSIIKCTFFYSKEKTKKTKQIDMTSRCLLFYLRK